MRVKDIVMEDFVNYKKPSMFISSCYCDYICCKEACIDKSVCSNEHLDRAPDIEITDERIVELYKQNNITKSIVLGGRDPMLQYQEVFNLIKCFRDSGVEDDIVIYTGRKKEEIPDKIEELKQFKNIIIKFGRYIPNKPSRYDEVLGITLVSDNQYAERIS